MGMLELFRFKNYTKLYFAGLASELGSFITDTAVMLFIFSRSGDNKAYLGMTRAVFLLFFTLGVLLGEPWETSTTDATCSLPAISREFPLFWSFSP